MNGFAVVDPLDIIADERADEILAESLPSFAGIDASELHSFVDQDIDWLVDFIFSADQPTVFGAQSKATKTTQLADLAVALTSKTDWLGEFKVSKRRRVLFITGESNYRGASKRISRALKARELEFADVSQWLLVEPVEFPRLPNLEDRMGIAADVAKHRIEVVIIDPLYRGLMGVDANRLADMGGAIVEFAKACQPASLIISHHTTKASARELGPPSLEDLSGAGLAESAGNWWLIGRNEPYKFDQQHDLCVLFGGRDEQSGIRRIKFDEKQWTFNVTSGQDLKDQREQEKQEKQQQKQEEQLRYARAQVTHCLTNQKQYQPKSWIETRSKATRDSTRQALAELLDTGDVIEGEYKDSRNRPQQGFGLRELGCSPCSRMLANNENGEPVDCCDDVRRSPL